MFWSTSVISINKIPFPTPITDIIVAIEYPKQKPLYIIIPNTIGIPITVVPKNHKVIAKIMFSNNVLFRIVIVSNFSVFFNFSIKLLKYDDISDICVSLLLFINITPKKIPTKKISVTSMYSFLLFAT